MIHKTNTAPAPNHRTTITNSTDTTIDTPAMTNNNTGPPPPPTDGHLMTPLPILNNNPTCTKNDRIAGIRNMKPTTTTDTQPKSEPTTEYRTTDQPATNTTTTGLFDPAEDTNMEGKENPQALQRIRRLCAPPEKYLTHTIME